MKTNLGTEKVRTSERQFLECGSPLPLSLSNVPNLRDAHDFKRKAAEDCRTPRTGVSSVTPFIIALLILTTAADAAPPPPVWDAPEKLSTPELPAALKRVDEAAAPLPSALTPAVQFQRVLLRIRAGAPMTEWREEVKAFTSDKDRSPAALAIRELALAWEARARMAEIDTALRRYYRANVKFPAKFGEASVPASAATDPWGEAWVYSPSKPKGFSDKFTSQRYTLTPAKHPQVRSVEDTLATPAPARNWKPTVREVSGQRVLEFRTAAGTVATQAGGRVEDAVVVYIGDGWAVLADLERIFTVTF